MCKSMPTLLFKRFHKLTREDLLTDLHLHSTWTDGHMTVHQTISKAHELGLRKIGFADHVRVSSTYYPDYAAELRQFSQEKLTILIGFEAKLTSATGEIDIATACRKTADYIIGSVHSLPVDNDFKHPSQCTAKELEEAEHRLALALIESGQADVLGHPGGMSIASHAHFDLGRMEDIIQHCAKTDVAFEINCRYHKKIINQLIKLLEIYNPYVSLGSDAHELSEVGECTQMLTQLMRDLCLK